MIGANGDAIFKRLCHAMGQPDLCLDERYATHSARGTHQSDLDALISNWTATLTISELNELMVAHKVPAGPVNKAPDMLDDPHFKSRNAITELQHPDLGPLPMQNCFPILSETPGTIRTPAPRLPGQDNEEIYKERFGLSVEKLADLAREGII